MSNANPESLLSLDTAEAIEAAAWEDLFDAAPPDLAAALGLRADRCSGALVLRSHRVDHLLFNRTFGLGSHQPEDRAALESAVARYRSRHIGRYLLHLCPGPAERLQGALDALGLARFHRNWVKLGRAAEPLAPVETRFRVLEARAEHVQAAARLLREGFDLPAQAGPLLERLWGRSGWQLFVATPAEAPDDGVVVSAGALFVRGDVGYLAMGATAPAHRGRGAQRAVMAARVRRALALGCRALFTETGEPQPGSSSSYHNMLYCGFRPLYSRENWGPPGLTWSTTGTR